MEKQRENSAKLETPVSVENERIYGDSENGAIDKAELSTKGGGNPYKCSLSQPKASSDLDSHPS